MEIRHKAFLHGWYYIYRLHLPKSESLCNSYPILKNYLDSVFDYCPDEYFLNGPRGSKLKININAETKCTTKHEVCNLASLGLKINEERYKSNHSKVQMFMLENDYKSIAIEVPLWLTPEESNNYCSLFGKSPLTGHIDVLRLEEDKIWVWDYKPNAKYEKFATTQTYFYALMLSKRTGIPLNDFMCGYFDSYHAFMFDPNKINLKAAEKNLLLEA